MAGATPTLRYEVVDVFTDRAYAGNPLAVVLDAGHLSTEQMQAVAREFNLSETAFPTDPGDAAADYRLRIFTPGAELPFAGHPSLGSAWVLRRLRRVAAGRVVQECGAGLVTLDVSDEEVELTGAEPLVGPPLDAAPFLAAVGLAPDALTADEVRWAGAGLAFGYLPVRPDAVARCRPDPALVADLGQGGICVFAVSGDRVHARVFAGGVGVTEDPATGSAALGLGAWLVAAGRAAPDGETSYEVAQGAEIGRPSRLRCVVGAAGGRAVRCRVSGSVVPVARGELVAPA
jgi:trans-2,3-dihydro-3-hydroxyanthranilate isomerase